MTNRIISNVSSLRLAADNRVTFWQKLVDITDDKTWLHPSRRQSQRPPGQTETPSIGEVVVTYRKPGSWYKSLHKSSYLWATQIVLSEWEVSPSKLEVHKIVWAHEPIQLVVNEVKTVLSFGSVFWLTLTGFEWFRFAFTSWVLNWLQMVSL